MGVQPQTLEIIFEVQRKMSNEKITQNKHKKKTFQLTKCVFFFLLFGPLLLSNLITFLFQTPSVNPFLFFLKRCKFHLVVLSRWIGSRRAILTVGVHLSTLFLRILQIVDSIIGSHRFGKSMISLLFYGCSLKALKSFLCPPVCMEGEEVRE